MAGYDYGQWKSNNAVAAEEKGLFPASVIGRKLGVTAKSIKELMSYSERHHTGSWFNWTAYYDLEEASARIEELKQYDRENKVETKEYSAKVQFITWRGGRRHPKADLHEYESIRVVEKGSFYTFFTTDIGVVRKKIDSNGTHVSINNLAKANG